MGERMDGDPLPPADVPHPGAGWVAGPGKCSGE